MQDAAQAQWRLDGVRVVRSDELDINTAQTPGMNRAAAITYARVGAEKLWAGTVVIGPMAKTGRIITGRWRASFTWSAGAPGCDGANGSNSWPRRAPAISSTCRPMCRTRKSMRATS